jgi:hypothetical protein
MGGSGKRHLTHAPAAKPKALPLPPGDTKDSIVIGINSEHSCQTKPICPAPTGKRAGRQGRKCCCRCGRARQTKPIPPVRHRGQVPFGKRVMTNLTRERLRQNKANSRADSSGRGLHACRCRRWDRLYKQSQFAEESQVCSFKFEAGGPSVESSDFKLYTSNSRRALGQRQYERAGGVRGQVRQTKPICPRDRPGRAPARRSGQLPSGPIV